MKHFLPVIAVALMSSMLFAQDVERMKSMVRDGRCAEAIAPLQKVFKSNFRKLDGQKAAVLLTECYLRDHKRDEALDVSSRFLEYHVSTIYRERMELARAIVQVAMSMMVSRTCSAFCRIPATRRQRLTQGMLSSRRLLHRF